LKILTLFFSNETTVLHFLIFDKLVDVVEKGMITGGTKKLILNSMMNNYDEKTEERKKSIKNQCLQ